MKKASLAVLATVSMIAAGNVSAASSGTICAGSTTAASGSDVAADSSAFVKQTFKTKCSANVHMAFEQDAINFGVGAGSTKGKTAFFGNTGGGAVSKYTDCSTTSGCTAAEATSAAAQALTNAGST